MKMSLGIWAIGRMATRFNPADTSRSWAVSATAQKVESAVEGLGGLMDDYEFHYPQELSETTWTRCAHALSGHGIYASRPARTSTSASAGRPLLA